MNVEYKTKIQDNPIYLLKYIKILMHKLERSKYPFTSITEAFKLVVNVKHKENRNFLDYSKRLNQSKEILKVQVGKDVLGHYVENLEEFNNET